MDATLSRIPLFVPAHAELINCGANPFDDAVDLGYCRRKSFGHVIASPPGETLEV